MDCGKVGELIAQVRKERGLTQAALAERLGVTGKAVSKWAWTWLRCCPAGCLPPRKREET